MKKEENKKESSIVTILPMKDHVIAQNEFYYDLKKDVMIDIDKRFIEVLKTEKVISTKG